MRKQDKILFKEESYKLIGVCMKIHSALGNGFLEAVYSEVLEKEFQINKIPFEGKMARYLLQWVKIR